MIATNDGSAARTSPGLPRTREEIIVDPTDRDATAAGLQPICTAHPAVRIVLIGRGTGPDMTQYSFPRSLARPG